MIRDPRTEEPAAKLRLVLDLFDSGVAMMRETLRRRFPDASDQTIAEALAVWLHERPGVLDAVGRDRAVGAALVIAARGFARGKSLEAEVVELVGTGG